MSHQETLIKAASELADAIITQASPADAAQKIVATAHLAGFYLQQACGAAVKNAPQTSDQHTRAEGEKLLNLFWQTLNKLNIEINNDALLAESARIGISSWSFSESYSHLATLCHDIKYSLQLSDAALRDALTISTALLIKFYCPKGPTLSFSAQAALAFIEGSHPSAQIAPTHLDASITLH